MIIDWGLTLAEISPLYSARASSILTLSLDFPPGIALSSRAEAYNRLSSPCSSKRFEVSEVLEKERCPREMVVSAASLLEGRPRPRALPLVLVLDGPAELRTDAPLLSSLFGLPSKSFLSKVSSPKCLACARKESSADPIKSKSAMDVLGPRDRRRVMETSSLAVVNGEGGVSTLYPSVEVEALPLLLT